MRIFRIDDSYSGSVPVQLPCQKAPSQSLPHNQKINSLAHGDLINKKMARRQAQSGRKQADAHGDRSSLDTLCILYKVRK